MYDNIFLDMALPSLPSEFLEYHGGNSHKIGWQTKDTPNQYLSSYKITEDGILQFEKVEGEWIAGEPLDDPENATWLDRMAAMGHFNKTSVVWEDVIGFTGTINFYDSWKHKNYTHDDESHYKFKYGWIEYCAVFLLGKVVSLELVSAEDPVEYTEDEVTENIKQWDKARADRDIENKKNRIEFPTPEQKLIDSIEASLRIETAIFDQDDLIHKLSSIKELIRTYREKHDRNYTKTN